VTRKAPSSGQASNGLFEEKEDPSYEYAQARRLHRQQEPDDRYATVSRPKVE